MNENKVFENFCNKINNAALNREKVGITLENANISCSGMFHVEPIAEDEDVVEMIAENMDIVINRSSESVIFTYDESCGTYIIESECVRLFVF